MPALHCAARARRVRVWCSVSEISSCRERSKLQSWIDLPVFANDSLQIEIAAIVVGKARVENGCRLVPRFANFISFERAFHDIGDRSTFTARQAPRQVARLCTAHRELGFGHAEDPT